MQAIFETITTLINQLTNNQWDVQINITANEITLKAERKI